jgi:hypothetical protein
LYKVSQLFFPDSITQQPILHRRIHSDPSFSFPKDSTNFNHLRVRSPLPIPIHDENKTIPSISYYQSDECGSYGSSYDSRGDIVDQNKQPKLTLGQSTHLEINPRQSISSEITLIDEQDSNLYNNNLSPIINNDEATLSINSTSPMDRSVIMSTSDYPTRSNYSKKNLVSLK